MEVMVTEELPVPAAKVWDLVREFGGAQKWLGGMVQKLEIEGAELVINSVGCETCRPRRTSL